METAGDSSRGDDLQTIVLRMDELGFPKRDGDRWGEKQKEVATAAIAENERRRKISAEEEEREPHVDVHSFYLSLLTN